MDTVCKFYRLWKAAKTTKIISHSHRILLDWVPSCNIWIQLGHLRNHEVNEVFSPVFLFVAFFVSLHLKKITDTFALPYLYFPVTWIINCSSTILSGKFKKERILKLWISCHSEGYSNLTPFYSTPPGMYIIFCPMYQCCVGLQPISYLVTICAITSTIKVLYYFFTSNPNFP